MRSSDHRKAKSLHATLFGTVIAAVAVAAIVSNSLRLAKALRPRNGDIIVFAQANANDDAADALPHIVAQLAGRSPTRFCTLDPHVMQQSGGSLIVEATGFNGSRSYRVHWAGGHTSEAKTDCGGSAELRLTLGELAMLTLAANGRAEHPAVAYNRPGIGRRVR